MKAGQEYRLCCKKKYLGDETFATVDFSDLESKVQVGDLIICDFGAVIFRVIGFEDENEFIRTKDLEEVILFHLLE